MKVCVAIEHRFVRLPDGSVWTQSQFPLPFWRRYLDVFDQVRCLARVLDVERLDGDWHRADGRGVSFAAVPYYVGMRQFFWRAAGIRRAVLAALQPGDAFVFRVPSVLGSIASRQLDELGYPYGVEVLGDPYQAFAPDAVQHPFRGLIRWALPRQLRRQCAHAAAACYVTEGHLQRSYPASCPTFAASSVELPEELIVRSPRRYASGAAPLNLIFVGSLEQYYKAPDVLIRSFATCVDRGLDVRLTIVGDGRHRGELESLATDLGCRDLVRFAGQLAAGARVYAELDAADVFVLPSRSEGLPRAMLEAMARGLPCIATRVGGIPEVLPPQAMVPPGDVQALADRICLAVRDPSWMNRMSEANLARVRAFRSGVLQQQRVRFYRVVRRSTERWLSRRGALACS